MIIVYAAVAGQSVVKLYAAAMFPGFFLALLYLVYIVGWAMINPKIAPPLPEEQTRVPVPDVGAEVPGGLFAQHAGRADQGAALAVESARQIEADGRAHRLLDAAQEFVLSRWCRLRWSPARSGLVWWYVVIHQQAAAEAAVDRRAATGHARARQRQPATPAEQGPTVEASISGSGALPPRWRADAQVRYYWRMDAERFEIVKLLTSSVMPLGILTVVVLAVILFGITTATESAGVGAAGAFLLAFQARTLDWKRTKEAVFLTAKTTAMVCWLFVGSALFSGVFAILGGQALVEQWVLSLNMSPVQFMILSQAIIFVLGWPLEWTEIIIIFVPIFLPLLKHFNIDPILWGTLVFVNLQAAFLSPPVAMSAFYLKGVAPKHVTLNQIFAGMMPYMLVVILCMVIMYVWPGMTLWLPNYLYGG